MACKKLLIIEDDESIREMMRDVLELQGYEVVTTSNGQDGIDTLNSMAAPPCLIILDLMMPKVNGWQFLEQQKQSNKLSGIPVIVCSAYPESAKAIHPITFIEKPIQLPALNEALRALCG